MDKFGYSKTIDPAAFERNQEAIYAENKYIFTCMNTEKICIFTDNGNLHQIKVVDIPFTTKFRDKGTPIDNLGNYSSAGEEIIYLCPSGKLDNKKLLFVSRGGMMKLVDSSEFVASKKTIASTKLNDGDALIAICNTDAVVKINPEDENDMAIISSQDVVLQTANGFFLKFPLMEIPEKKKGAVGVRGIKLSADDKLEEVYLIPESADISIDYKGKEVSLKKLKMAKRDTKGTKLRV